MRMIIYGKKLTTAFLGSIIFSGCIHASQIPIGTMTVEFGVDASSGTSVAPTPVLLDQSGVLPDTYSDSGFDSNTSADGVATSANATVAFSAGMDAIVSNISLGATISDPDPDLNGGFGGFAEAQFHWLFPSTDPITLQIASVINSSIPLADLAATGFFGFTVFSCDLSGAFCDSGTDLDTSSNISLLTLPSKGGAYKISGVAAIGAGEIDGIAQNTTESFNWNLKITAVPVPAAVWLFGSGLLGLVGMARRKKA